MTASMLEWVSSGCECAAVRWYDQADQPDPCLITRRVTYHQGLLTLWVVSSTAIFLRQHPRARNVRVRGSEDA